MQTYTAILNRFLLFPSMPMSHTRFIFEDSSFPQMESSTIYDLLRKEEAVDRMRTARIREDRREQAMHASYVDRAPLFDEVQALLPPLEYTYSLKNLVRTMIRKKFRHIGEKAGLWQSERVSRAGQPHLEGQAQGMKSGFGSTSTPQDKSCQQSRPGVTASYTLALQTTSSNPLRPTSPQKQLSSRSDEEDVATCICSKLPALQMYYQANINNHRNGEHDISELQRLGVHNVEDCRTILAAFALLNVQFEAEVERSEKDHQPARSGEAGKNQRAGVSSRNQPTREHDSSHFRPMCHPALRTPRQHSVHDCKQASGSHTKHAQTSVDQVKPRVECQSFSIRRISRQLPLLPNSTYRMPDPVNKTEHSGSTPTVSKKCRHLTTETLKDMPAFTALLKAVEEAFREERDHSEAP